MKITTRMVNDASREVQKLLPAGVFHVTILVSEEGCNEEGPVEIKIGSNLPPDVAKIVLQRVGETSKDAASVTIKNWPPK